MTRVYIARERMHEGQPCIALDIGKPTIQFANRVDIAGASSVVFDPSGMPANGVRRPIQVWVETDSTVYADGERVS